LQTFLISSDFYKTAKVLHPKHLGNQYYFEGMILLTGGWSHHPASKMWRNNLYTFTSYLLALQYELSLRGKWYGKTAVKLRKIRKSLKDNGYPDWINEKRLYKSHRSNLLRKDKEKDWNWYVKFNWTEPDDLKYWWPIK